MLYPRNMHLDIALSAVIKELFELIIWYFVLSKVKNKYRNFMLGNFQMSPITNVQTSISEIMVGKCNVMGELCTKWVTE